MADYAREELVLSDCEEMAEIVENERYGGPQNEDDDEEEEDEGADAGAGGGGGAVDDEERKRQERERKKAEVRARLAEQGKKGKAKKGFLTPERKKKLRKLLTLKAAEEMKAQALKKEQERKATLEKRVAKLPDIDSISDQGKLQQIAEELINKIKEVEAIKYDLDFVVRQKDHEINEMSIAVNDLRGKFVKPTLKKVSKYDNKFKKMQGAPKGGKMDFAANLKQVKQDKYGLDKLKEGGHEGEHAEGHEPEAAEAEE